MSGLVHILVGLLLLVGTASTAAESPQLCVLSEHFDMVTTWRIDARGELSPAAPPLTVRAPHDAVFIAARRRLVLSAEYKGRPCLVSYDLTPEGALRRVGDPVPTAERDPQLLLWKDGIIAWHPARVQFFPLVDGVPQPPQRSGAGVDALVCTARHAFALQRGRVAPYDLATLALGVSLEAGYAPSSMAVDPSGQHLCVLTLDDFDRHLRVFDIGADGGLQAASVRPRTLREAQRKLVFGERFAYLLNAGDTISTFTDALVPRGRPTASAAGLDDLLLFGGFGYAVGTSEGAVRAYRVEKDGSLHATRACPLPAQAAGTRLLLLTPGAAGQSKSGGQSACFRISAMRRI